MSGIFRSVSLLSRPRGGVADYHLRASYDHVSGLGTLSVDGALVTVPELGIENARGASDASFAVTFQTL